MEQKHFSFLFCGIAFCAAGILFLSYSSNCFRIVPQERFAYFQRDMESFIVGRMVKSQHDGIFSAAGLPGLGGNDQLPPAYDQPSFVLQYNAFFTGRPLPRYLPYLSQSGGQGIIAGIAAVLSPFTAENTLFFLYLANSALTVCMLMALIVWSYHEWGIGASLCMYAGCFFSPVFHLFARNLWWCFGAFYLPLIVVLLLCPKTPYARRAPFYAGVFCAVFIKCFLNGYEYISAVLIMAVTPIVYYAVTCCWEIKRSIAVTSTTLGVSLAAVMANMFLLLYQVAQVKGDWYAGIRHIIMSFLKRSHGNPVDFSPVYGEGLRASVGSVMNIYLNDPLSLYGGIRDGLRYWQVIAMALLGILFLFLYNRKKEKENSERRRIEGCGAMILVSLCAPLSWFLIFKAHAYVHNDDVVWYMPFMLYVWGGIGIVASVIVRELYRAVFK